MVVDCCLTDLSERAHRVVHITVTENKRTEPELQCFDSVAHIVWLQPMELKAQKDCSCLQAEHDVFRGLQGLRNRICVSGWQIGKRCPGTWLRLQIRGGHR
jgi:hypothetical protein